MGLDIAGATVDSSVSGISITTNSVKGLDFNSSNFAYNAKKPYFVVGKTYTTGAWQNFTSGGWLNMPLDWELTDNQGNYNTSTYAFTAPVTGSYHFSASSYTYKSSATSSDSYLHPIFTVNDSQTARHASATTQYRIRNRTYYSGGYAADIQINNIFYLTAGDYVKWQVYASSSLQWYDAHTQFTGFLIG
jgi:hypothetical protein